MKNEFIEVLKKDAITAQQTYYLDPSIDTFNKVRRIVRCLAQMLLIDKAAGGSTQAIIELEKSYQYKSAFPSLTPKDLLKLEDLTSDELSDYMRKFNLQTNDNKVKDMTGAAIIEAYQSDQISLQEAKDMMSLIEKAQRASDKQQIVSEFTIKVDQETRDALYADE